MFIKKSLFALFIATLSISQVWADALPLSDAQIQKLKHYFPEEDGHNAHVWDGTPITIVLPLNQEKRIVFPTQISVDIKGALTTDQLRIINNDKSLYLTALKAFSSTRIYVTLTDSNKIVLVDLTADTHADNTTSYIATQPNSTPSSLVTRNVHNDDNFAVSEQAKSSTSDSDSYVTLTRFAWQQLYAPNRLLTHAQSIVRVPMHTQPMLTTLVYGDKVYAHPEISWMLNDTYVTAIELRNKYPHATTIDVRHDVCGVWQAATLYPRDQLKAAGNKSSDSTQLIVVSKRPFGESMEVCNAHA